MNMQTKKIVSCQKQSPDFYDGFIYYICECMQLEGSKNLHELLNYKSREKSLFLHNIKSYFVEERK